MDFPAELRVKHYLNFRFLVAGLTEILDSLLRIFQYNTMVAFIKYPVLLHTYNNAITSPSIFSSLFTHSHFEI